MKMDDKARHEEYLHFHFRLEEVETALDIICPFFSRDEAIISLRVALERLRLLFFKDLYGVTDVPLVDYIDRLNNHLAHWGTEEAKLNEAISLGAADGFRAVAGLAKVTKERFLELLEQKTISINSISGNYQLNKSQEVTDKMIANPDELKRQIQEGYEAGLRAAASQANNDCVKAGCTCAGIEEPEIRPDGLRIWQVKEEKDKLETAIKAAFERFTAKTGFAVTYIDVDVDTEDYPLPSYKEIKVTIQL